MITGGHIASSYLLAEGAKHLGLPLSSNEVLQIILAGNVVDIDFLIGLATGKTGEAHHQNITHTPIGTLLLFIVLVLIFHPSPLLALLFLFSLFLHLILDDIGYWIYKFGLFKIPTNPQINWLYPLTAFHKNKLIKGNKEVLRFYVIKAWPIALLEFFLIILATIIFIKTRT